MFSRKSDLIVPMHDRRKRRRILTLKNFGIAMAILMAAFTIISIRSELDHRNQHGSYGRLLDRRLEKVEVPEPKPVEVVGETTAVADQSAPDPMLLDPLAREQWLRVDEPQAARATSVAYPAASTDGDLAIVGGPNGVSVVRQERRKPVLSGGFGRSGSVDR